MTRATPTVDYDTFDPNVDSTVPVYGVLESFGYFTVYASPQKTLNAFKGSTGDKVKMYTLEKGQWKLVTERTSEKKDFCDVCGAPITSFDYIHGDYRSRGVAARAPGASWRHNWGLLRERGRIVKPYQAVFGCRGCFVDRRVG